MFGGTLNLTQSIHSSFRSHIKRSVAINRQLSSINQGVQQRQPAHSALSTARQWLTTVQGDPKIGTIVLYAVTYQILTDFLNYFTVRMRR